MHYLFTKYTNSEMQKVTMPFPFTFFMNMAILELFMDKSDEGFQFYVQCEHPRCVQSIVFVSMGAGDFGSSEKLIKTHRA